MSEQDQDNLRIDKWLWFTRFYKTRALAAKAVAGGHVKINGRRAKASAIVIRGDRVDLVRDQLPFSVQVDGIPSRRGPAAVARLNYVESEESRERRQQILANLRSDRMQMPQTDGRPDKHTRRKLRDRRRLE